MAQALRVIFLAIGLVMVVVLAIWWRSPDQLSAILTKFGQASSAAGEPPQQSLLDTASSAISRSLSRQEASRILYFMGCSPSNIGALVHGVGVAGLGATASENMAMVLAVCKRSNGKAEVETHTFWYDRELGWFYFERDTRGNRIRIWTKAGYQEVGPPQQPPVIGPDGLPVN